MIDVAPYRFEPGTIPLLVSFPHVGTHVPPAIAARLTPLAATVPDTDWEVDRLYDFVGAMGASRLIASCSRYVVDVNRPPDGRSLYPGQAGTDLVPTTDFDGVPLYRPGAAPDADEVERRKEAVWKPYHAALQSELARLRSMHGVALLWEAHSIRAEVPRLFEGRLPDLNIGTADGASCAPGLGERLLELAAASPYSAVLNGRFKGGYITRHYGRPETGVHAVQMEIVQAAYMDDAERSFDEARAARLRPTLRTLVEAALVTVREA
jgi:N-formylglutamate deformylase